jgi:uncharacterized membrane protein
MITIDFIEKYFCLFLIYSFSGWLIEVIGELIKSKKFVNRGFLIGPICPIYGIGAVLITILFTHYADDIFAVFSLSIILCGSLEYFTSLIMEKMFHTRWWDYSNKKFNINGRICLDTMALFAIAGVLIVKILSPSFLKLIDLIPFQVTNLFSTVTFVLFIIDIVLSLKIMNKILSIKDTLLSSAKDTTEITSKKVRQILLEKSAPIRRIILAFPDAFSETINVGKERIQETAKIIKNNVVETKEKVAEKVNDVRENTIVMANSLKSKTIDELQRRARVMKRIKGIRLKKTEKSDNKK